MACFACRSDPSGQYGFWIECIGDDQHSAEEVNAGLSTVIRHVRADAESCHLNLFTSDAECAAIFGVTALAPEQVEPMLAARTNASLDWVYAILVGAGKQRYFHLAQTPDTAFDVVEAGQVVPLKSAGFLTVRRPKNASYSQYLQRLRLDFQRRVEAVMNRDIYQVRFQLADQPSHCVVGLVSPSAAFSYAKRQCPQFLKSDDWF